MPLLASAMLESGAKRWEVCCWVDPAGGLKLELVPAIQDNGDMVGNVPETTEISWRGGLAGFWRLARWRDGNGFVGIWERARVA